MVINNLRSFSSRTVVISIQHKISLFSFRSIFYLFRQNLIFYVVFPTLVDACLVDLVASEGKFHVHNNLFFDPSKDEMAEK